MQQQAINKVVQGKYVLCERDEFVGDRQQHHLTVKLEVMSPTAGYQTPRVEVWNDQAEYFLANVNLGDTVRFVCREERNEYVNRNGKNRTAYKLIADGVLLVPSPLKRDGSAQGGKEGASVGGDKPPF